MGYGRTTLNGIQPAVADVDRFITSGDMANGDYGPIQNAGLMPETNTARHVTLTRTFTGGADTPGTVLIYGTSLSGEIITETLIPSAVDATLVEGTKWFRKVINITSAGWVLVAAGDDTITFGCGADAIIAEGTGVLHGIQINTTANGTITVSDAGGTIAVLPVNVAVGTFYQWDVNWSGWLRVVMAAASNITVMHSGSNALTYVLA
jgi:hypothetical protein